MKRNVSLAEISDGRLYKANDMVKADCGGCNGCSRCCHGMGNSIILDPYDVYRMTTGMGKSMQELLAASVELNVVDGVILPNLKMASGNTEACSFLNPEGRCSIHAFRPGICRLFPLGRFYENGSFKYFLQVHECPKPNKTKVKIKKWLDTPDLKRYETYICDWHYYLRDLKTRIEAHPEQMKGISMDVLQKFYLTPYDSTADFYTEFYERLKNAKKQLTL